MVLARRGYYFWGKLYQFWGNGGIWEYGNVADIPPMLCQNDVMAKSEDTVKLVIGKELKIRFKSLCVQAETDMSSVAKELIAQWCSEQERKLVQEKKSYE
ncbi:hypothetical protein BLD44_007070 [Mastigocladus laminosus UU774]|nr:hypothetical protein BLD44_007070 [Mastigocladus laminosus UU774]